MTRWFALGVLGLLGLAAAPAAAQPLARLINPNTVPFQKDLFGTHVVQVGSLVAVSAPFDNEVGSVHLFDPVTRAFQRTIANPTGVYTRFGHSMADVGGLLLVGAPGHPFPATAGAAFLFDPSDGTLIHSFAHPSPLEYDAFGASVAAVAGKILIGSPGDDTGGLRSGIAFLFDPVTGALEETFLNPTAAAGDHFGGSVAAFGGDALIAALDAGQMPGDDGGEVYRIDIATGTLVDTFVNPDPGGGGCSFVGDEFGMAMAPLGANLLISSPCESVAGGGKGVVYLFDPSGALLQTYGYPGSVASSGAFFGCDIAVIGSRLFVGAAYDVPFNFPNFIDVPAAGAVLEVDVASGALLRTIANPFPHHLEEFGLSIAAVGGNIVIGCASDTSFAGSGEAYLYGTTDCAGEPAGTLCPDDGTLCSLDTCDGAGSCVHPFAPQPTCRATVAAGKSKLVLKDKASPGRDKLIWKWKGEPTGKGEFGHVRVDHLADEIALCIYDHAAGVPSLAFSASVLAGDVCDGGGGACWKESPRGWKYKNRAGNATGVTKMILKANDKPGRAKVIVKAKGANLALPSPLGIDQDPSVVAQLLNSGGECWSATYSTALRNTPAKFKAKSD